MSDPDFISFVNRKCIRILYLSQLLLQTDESGEEKIEFDGFVAFVNHSCESNAYSVVNGDRESEYGFIPTVTSLRVISQGKMYSFSINFSGHSNKHTGNEVSIIAANSGNIQHSPAYAGK